MSENVCTGRSAFGKAPVRKGSYLTRRGAMRSTPNQPWKVVVRVLVESHAMVMSQCQVQKKGHRKSNKACCSCTTKSRRNRAGETCKFEPTYLFPVPGCIPQVSPVATCFWMTQPGYWLMLSRESLALIGWSKKSVTTIMQISSGASQPSKMPSPKCLQKCMAWILTYPGLFNLNDLPVAKESTKSPVEIGWVTWKSGELNFLLPYCFEVASEPVQYKIDVAKWIDLEHVSEYTRKLLVTSVMHDHSCTDEGIQHLRFISFGFGNRCGADPVTLLKRLRDPSALLMPWCLMAKILFLLTFWLWTIEMHSKHMHQEDKTFQLTGWMPAVICVKNCWSLVP